MLEDLKKYEYIKKSKSELKRHEIVDGISKRLLEEKGYLAFYYLGVLDQLSSMARVLTKTDCLKRSDLIGLINELQYIDDVPNDIKNLAKMILDEFDDKETTK